MGFPYGRLCKLANTVIYKNAPIEAALFSVMFQRSMENNQVISLKQVILDELVAIEDFNFSDLARKILANYLNNKHTGATREPFKTYQR